MVSIPSPCSSVGNSLNSSRLPKKVHNGAEARIGAAIEIGRSRIA